jgi:hypothetical protein
MAEITVSMLMHRLEKSVMSDMVPMRAIAVLRVDFWESMMSMTFLLVAWFSVDDSRSTSYLFFWGRKADGSTFSVSCSRLVTFLVAKLPWSMRAFVINLRVIWDDQMFIQSWSLASFMVKRMRSAKELAREA